MFEESCKQARRVYLLLATVSIAVGLFALTARPPDDLYRRAHSQVGAALAVDWSAYEDYADERIQDFAQQRYVDNRTDYYGYVTLESNDGHRLVQASSYELVHETLSLEELFERLMRGSPYRMFGGGMEGVRHAEIGYAVDPNHAALISTFERYQTSRGDDREPYELTPVDLVRFVKSPAGTVDAMIATPDPEVVAAAVYRHAQSAAVQVARSTPARAMVEGFTVEGRAALAGTRWSSNVRLELTTETLPLAAFDESMGIQRSEQGWQRREHVEQLDAAVVEVPGTSVAAWLAAEWPDLGVVRGGVLEPFAGLQHVWPTIADRPLLDADLYLAAALSEEEAAAPRVSLGGVELPAALIPIGGPLVVAILALQLARLLGFLVRRAPREEAARDAPWLVLHSRMGLLEAALVVLALPLAAQALVAWQALSAQNAVQIAGWACTAVAVAAGAYVLIRIARLQRWVMAQDMEEPADEHAGSR